MGKLWAWTIAGGLVAGCGGDEVASGSDGASSSGSGSGGTTTTGTVPTTGSLPTSGGPGTQGETDSSGAVTASSSGGTSTSTGSTSTGEGTSSSGGDTSTSSGDTSGSSSSGGASSSGESSTGEPLVCPEVVESAGGALGFGGLGGEQALGFAVAADGSRYSGGVFFGPSVDLKPGGGAVFPAQGEGGNMWLNKLAGDGSYVYGYTWPTVSGQHCYVWGFAPDEDGSVVVVGHFVGKLDLDPGAGVDMHVAGNGTSQLGAFMIKLDAAGAYQWGRSWNSGWATAFGVARGGDGALYVTGYFGNTIDLDPGPGEDKHTATGMGNGTDGYLSKFDADGNFVWGRTWGAGGTVYAFDVAVGGDGSVAVTGTAGGPADLDPGPGEQIHVGQGLADTFVTRFTDDGTWSWGFAVGGSGFEQINDVWIDSVGQVWAVGGFSSPDIDLDPGPGVAMFKNTSQSYDAFVARYDAMGAHGLSFALGGTGHDNVYGVVGDCGDLMYVAGHFSASVDLDPGPDAAMHASAGQNDPFVLAIDGAGQYRWSRSWPNGDNATAQGIGVDGDRMAHAQINYYVDIDADAGAGVKLLPAKGDMDVLLEKLRPGSGDW